MRATASGCCLAFHVDDDVAPLKLDVLSTGKALNPAFHVDDDVAPLKQGGLPEDAPGAQTGLPRRRRRGPIEADQEGRYSYVNIYAFHVDDDVAPLKLIFFVGSLNTPLTLPRRRRRGPIEARCRHSLDDRSTRPFHVDDDVAPLKQSRLALQRRRRRHPFHVDDDVAPLKRLIACTGGDAAGPPSTSTTTGPH